MKTLIVCAGRSGATREVSLALKEAVGNGADFLDLASRIGRRAARKLDIAQYDAVFLGGGIQAGKMPDPVVKFAASNASALKTRKLGLFVCCLDGTKAQEFMRIGFGAELVSTAVRAEWMGGRYRPDDHSFLIRALMRKIRNCDDSEDTLRFDGISEFAEGVLS